MSTLQTYFLELKKLIHKEWQAEREFHFEKLAKLSPDERRKKGYSWFPLEVLEQGYKVGQRPYVIFRRTKALGVPHEFRSGSKVELYPLKEAESKRLTGMIRWVDRDKMNIIFSKERLPDWLFGTALGVDVYFDERSYKVMDKALEIMSELEAGRLKDLTTALLGINEPFFSKHSRNYFNAQLNDSQNEAIDYILRSEDYAVIHGPPGTGKTTTLVAAIKQICKKESPVLVCAPSNTAVDHLIIKLSESGLNAIRIGNLSRMHDKVHDYTLDEHIESHPDSKSIKTMKKDVQALRKKSQCL